MCKNCEMDSTTDYLKMLSTQESADSDTALTSEEVSEQTENEASNAGSEVEQTGDNKEVTREKSFFESKTYGQIKIGIMVVSLIASLAAIVYYARGAK